MKSIFRTEFGSHVYGTNVPTSDQDFKAVFIPDFKDIILQRAPRTINLSTKEDKNSRNTQDDIDEESFSLQEYCKLLAQGQTVALDMLFTPEKHWTRNDLVIWQELRKNKDKFLHKGTSSFVGYTKQQAAKYGIKGFRVAAIEETLKFLKTLDRHKRLSDYSGGLAMFVEAQNSEFTKLVEIVDKGKGVMLHLECCNRKVPFHAKIGYAVEIFQKIYDEYGARAQMAKENQGIDWKALLHAVRVSREAEELLLTGNITFPRPEKDLLLQIRKGELDYETRVAPLIEEGLLKIEEAKEKSTLPADPDKIWIDEFVFSCYTS